LRNPSTRSPSPKRMEQTSPGIKTHECPQSKISSRYV
jgi:hypothetical protein